MKLASNQLTTREYHEIPQWDAFVHAHPQGTVLHTTCMIHCEKNTRLHYPYAHGAFDSEDNLCAILVAVRVATMSGFPSSWTSRSIQYAEPIYLNTPAGLAGVCELLKQHDEYMRMRTLFAEVRPIHEVNQTVCPLLENDYRRIGYLNYELKLDKEESELFSLVGQKCRNNVRCAQRKGVFVEEVDPVQSIDVVYKLLSESYAHSKIPMVDRTLFQAASINFCRSQLRIIVAKYQNMPVAVGCFLIFKNRVLCWYAGTKRIVGVPAMSLIFWEAIRRFSLEGYGIFDFAGAGWQGENYGPGHFKAKFGGLKTNYGRYRKIYAPWMMKAASCVYEKLRVYISPSMKFDPHTN